MNCPKCGVPSTENVTFCGNCGYNLAPVRATFAQTAAFQQAQSAASAAAPAYAHQPAPHYIPGPPVATPIVYANFFARFFALVLDEIIAFSLAGMAWGALFLLSLAFGYLSGGREGLLLAFILPIFLGGFVGLITYITYFVKLETGPSQATFGKRMLGIKVANASGNRISVGQSLGRLLIKNTFSLLFFLLGYIMAAFTEKKQALHDFAASTYVVNA